MRSSFTRLCVGLVSLSILALGAPVVAEAGIIATGTAMASVDRDADLAKVRAGLARAEVRDRLVTLGVEPAQVEGRLAALTDAELATLAQRFDQAPAGGDALALIGIVFLVLLLLEYTGTIDIFKKVP
jgi:hypothetical protein